MKLECDNEQLYYEVLEGRTKDTHFDAIILLHSLGVDSRLWSFQREALKDYSPKVILFDTRGHGKSDTSSEITAEKWSDDIKHLCDTLSLNKVVLCGISMGGVQSIGFAVKHPEYIAGLILADTFAKIPAQVEEKINLTAGVAKEQGMKKYSSTYLNNTLSDSPTAQTIRADLNDAIAKMNVEDYYHSAKACFTVDYEDQLQQIDVPTLVVIGEYDLKTPIELSKTIQQKIPNALLVTIPRGRHLSNVDNPEAFNRVITGFLKML